MEKQYTVTGISGQGATWALPQPLISQLKLKDNQTILLKFGSAATSVTVVQNKGSSNIGLSEETLAALGIPQNTSVKVKPLGPKTFGLGPVIGILTFSGYVPAKLHYYNKWVTLNRQGGLVYVFRGKDINADEQKIVGYYYEPRENIWKKGVFPFPDSVIDRCYPNAYKYHAILENVIGPGKICNKRSLISKTRFFNTLSADNLLREHLPETRVYSSFSDVTYFLEKYGQAFLKPVGSMKGAGIIVVTKLQKGIECAYSSAGKDKKEILESIEEFGSILKAVKATGRKYIVQQAIQSVKYRGGPLSFRINPMKNAEGKWVVPGMVTLGSMGESYTTNYSSGGKSIPLKHILNSVLPKLPYEKDEFFKILYGLTVKAAISLDKKCGPLGDLGVDLVISRDGKPWLLEANGNPAKIAAFVENDFPAWRILTYRYPTDYASYLAGYINAVP